MTACNRFRVEVCHYQGNDYHVSVQPVEHLGRELGELAFFDRAKAQVQLVAPKEEG